MAITGDFTTSRWDQLIKEIDKLKLEYKVDILYLSNPALRKDLLVHIKRVGIPIH